MHTTMQYLLEGLQSDDRHPIKAYAFSAITETNKDEVVAEWGGKGVEPILYSLGGKRDEHTLLWNTLDEWSKYSQSKKQWYERLFNLAKRSPSQLKSYQRGQVAYMVSTTEGAEYFSSQETAPSAEWLCVFDKKLRFYDKKSSVVFPSKQWLARENYKIDSDRGGPISNGQEYDKFEYTLQDAWDAFGITKQDREGCIDNSSERYYAALYGHEASPALPPRLGCIAWWLARVSCQRVEIDKSEEFGRSGIVREPNVLFWAIDNLFLHPWIQQKIKGVLINKENGNKEELVFYKAWCYLFDSWKQKQDNSLSLQEKCSEIRLQIKNNKSTAHAIDQFAKLFQPYLKVNKVSIGHSSNNTKKPLCISDLVSVQICYEIFSSEEARSLLKLFPEKCFRPLLDALLDHYVHIQKLSNRLQEDEFSKKDYIDMTSLILSMDLFIKQFGNLMESDQDAACDFSEKIQNNGHILNLLRNKVKKLYDNNIPCEENIKCNSGVITINNEGYKTLIQQPLGSILTKEPSIDFSASTLHKPFDGLIKHKPVLAFRELSFHAKRNRFYFLAWEAFFNEESQKTTLNPRLLTLIARRLTSYNDGFWVSDEGVDTETSCNVSSWLLTVAKQLYGYDNEAFENLIEKIIQIFKKYPNTTHVAISHRKNQKNRNWLRDSIHSPVGNIAEALFQLASYDDENKWFFCQLKSLLELSDDAYLYSLVRVSCYTEFLFNKNATWTIKYLIPTKSSNQSTIEAFFNGCGFKNTTSRLFIQIKPLLIWAMLNHKLPKQSEYYQYLTEYIFEAWATQKNDSSDGMLEDNELQQLLEESGEEFRSEVLHLIEIRKPNALDDDRIIEFFENVWPRKKKVKIIDKRLKLPQPSCQLIDIIFHDNNKTIFDQLSAIFIDNNCLIPIDDIRLEHLLSRLPDNLITKDLIKVLSILYIIIPEKSYCWIQKELFKKKFSASKNFCLVIKNITMHLTN